MVKVTRAKDIETRRAPAARFTGTVLHEALLEAQAPVGIKMARVTFEPGARTFWHAHPEGQTLYVLAGNGRVQKRGEPGIEIGPGDVVFAAPGEWHWHGAAPRSAMSHLSITTGSESVWMEEVSDEAYTRALD